MSGINVAVSDGPKREAACPFCDCTPQEVAESIRNYGLWAQMYCNFCGVREPPSDVHARRNNDNKESKS